MNFLSTIVVLKVKLIDKNAEGPQSKKSSTRDRKKKSAKQVVFKCNPQELHRSWNKTLQETQQSMLATQQMHHSFYSNLLEA